MRTGVLVLSVILSAALPASAFQPMPLRIHTVVGVPTNIPTVVHFPGPVQGGVKIQLPAPKIPTVVLTLSVKAAAPVVGPAVEKGPTIEKINGLFDGTRVRTENTVVVPAAPITLPEMDLEKDIGLR